jgi:hypothetical protein
MQSKKNDFFMDRMTAENEGDMILLKRWEPLTQWHNITSQKSWILIYTSENLKICMSKFCVIMSEIDDSVERSYLHGAQSLLRNC